jgi:AcrR family transcriptional regulator
MVVRCAKEVFSQKGYYQASISDIIQRADIARGTFYLYFKSKRDVFNKILDELAKELEGVIKRIDLDPSAPLLGQVRNILRSVIMLALEDPYMTKIVLSRAGGLDSEFDSKLREFYETVLGWIESSFQHGIELGLVRECNPKVIAHCVLGCMKEVVDHILSDAEATSQLDQILDEVLNFGLQGFLIPLDDLKS